MHAYFSPTMLQGSFDRELEKARRQIAEQLRRLDPPLDYDKRFERIFTAEVEKAMGDTMFVRKKLIYDEQAQARYALNPSVGRHSFFDSLKDWWNKVVEESR